MEGRASKIRVTRQVFAVLVIAGVAACDGPMEPGPGKTATGLPIQEPQSPSTCPYYAVPSDCPPFPTGGDRSISGLVVERIDGDTRPRQGQSLWAWVEFPDGRGYSAHRVQTDANGAYRFPSLPSGVVVVVQAFGGGFDQPCAAVVQLGATDVTVDVEVVSQSNPIVEANPSPPSLTGVVYENTAAGRQPVAGALVYFETLFDEIAARTTTDEHGRYSLCHLPDINTFVSSYKAGYQYTPIAVAVSGAMTMDLEMKRK